MRREFPKKVKVAAFQRADGRCEECTAPLAVGKFHYDHRIPDALGGKPTLENCTVLCLSCHSVKTTQEDVPTIAKSNRVRSKHLGANAPSRRPLPGGKNSPFKIKIGGAVVRREGV